MGQFLLMFELVILSRGNNYTGYKCFTSSTNSNLKDSEILEISTLFQSDTKIFYMLACGEAVKKRLLAAPHVNELMTFALVFNSAGLNK